MSDKKDPDKEYRESNPVQYYFVLLLAYLFKIGEMLSPKKPPEDSDEKKD